jgi:hypothetical protein
MMKKLLKLLLALVLAAVPVLAQASDDNEKPAKSEPGTSNTQESSPADLDFQLYLLVGSNTPSQTEKLPAALDGVAKQLKTALPFSHYRLSGTMLNRVSGFQGKMSLRWNGEPLFAGTSKYAYYEMSANGVLLKQDNSISVLSFIFGGKLPLTAGSLNGQSTVVYENIGLDTRFTVREGEPAIIGTLSAGQGGEIGILVVNFKRSGK